MRNLCLLIVFMFCVAMVFATNPATSVKIRLNNGTVIKGELVLKTDEIIMIRNSEGARYQFKLTEVAAIDTVVEKPIVSADSIFSNVQSSLSANISVCGGLASAKNLFSNQLGYGVSVLFGKDDVVVKKSYSGLGVGLISFRNNTQNVRLLPLFLHLQTSNKKRFFAGINAGYSFSAIEFTKGGVYSQLNVGYKLHNGGKTAFLIAASTAVYQIKTTLNELNTSGSYSYFGATTVLFTGIKTTWKF